MLTVNQLAEMTGRKPQIIRAAVWCGLVPGVKCGQEWRIKEEDAEAYIKSGRAVIPGMVCYHQYDFNFSKSTFYRKCRQGFYKTAVKKRNVWYVSKEEVLRLENEKPYTLEDLFLEHYGYIPKAAFVKLAKKKGIYCSEHFMKKYRKKHRAELEKRSLVDYYTSKEVLELLDLSYVELQNCLARGLNHLKVRFEANERIFNAREVQEIRAYINAPRRPANALLVSEVARKLGRSRSGVNKLVKAGVLPVLENIDGVKFVHKQNFQIMADIIEAQRLKGVLRFPWDTFSNDFLRGGDYGV